MIGVTLEEEGKTTLVLITANVDKFAAGVEDSSVVIEDTTRVGLGEIMGVLLITGVLLIVNVEDTLEENKLELLTGMTGDVNGRELALVLRGTVEFTTGVTAKVEFDATDKVTTGKLVIPDDLVLLIITVVEMLEI